MLRVTPKSTRPATIFPDTTLSRSASRSLTDGAVRAFDPHHRNRLRNLHRQPQGPERAALLRLDQRHLRHIDPAAAKAAFAIHQVIAPELAEKIGRAHV